MPPTLKGEVRRGHRPKTARPQAENVGPTTPKHHATEGRTRDSAAGPRRHSWTTEKKDLGPLNSPLKAGILPETRGVTAACQGKRMGQEIIGKELFKIRPPRKASEMELHRVRIPQESQPPVLPALLVKEHIFIAMWRSFYKVTCMTIFSIVAQRHQTWT